jgi:hypothetical protein
MVWLLAAIIGCSSAGQNLKPAASATKAAGLKNAAIASDRDVVAVVQSRAWPGESRVLEHVAVLRVRVTNGNAQPIRVRYEDLRLIAGDGRRYAAIPPVAADVKAGAFGRNFTYSGFQIAPHLAAAYPGVDAYRGAFDYDPKYYDEYQNAWGPEWLPSNEMKSWALPEGVLDSGGYVEGFVYFERVDKGKGENVVRFDAEFAKAVDPQQIVARISIPFQVD